MKQGNATQVLLDISRKIWLRMRENVEQGMWSGVKPELVFLPIFTTEKIKIVFGDNHSNG